jgi:2'-5' RNA ligase
VIAATLKYTIWQERVDMKKSGKSAMTKLLAIFILAFVLVAVIVSAQKDKRPPIEKINVFAVVSPNIEIAFKDAASALYQEQGLEAFPLKGYQVHCTLYMTQYPEGSKDNVLAKVEELASRTSEFSVNSTGLAITSGNWFFMNIERNRNLQTLSDAVVEALAPLRAKSNYIPEWAKEFPNKVEYIAKYGSPNVYSEFNPHLTFLAKSELEKLQKFTQKHAESDFAKVIAGKIVAIGAGIADRDGQIKEPWKIFPLQSAK